MSAEQLAARLRPQFHQQAGASINPIGSPAVRLPLRAFDLPLQAAAPIPARDARGEALTLVYAAQDRT